MHTSIMLLALLVAIVMRLAGKYLGKYLGKPLSWQWRWHLTLGQFLLPVLLLLSVAIAVVIMGTQGEMIGWHVGWLGYYLGWGFALYSLVRIIHLFWQGTRSVKHLANADGASYQASQELELKAVTQQNASTSHDNSDLGRVSQGDLAQWQTGSPLPNPLLPNPLLPNPPLPNLLQQAKILEIPALFAAQVGFWDSQLVLSRRLINTLSPEHLAAVLYHEQAHVYYRDTFWFFWLGCGRHIAPWLPHTEALWQELLLLRELRADRWALNHTDGLLLAESLMALVQDHCGLELTFAAALHTDLGCSNPEDRLEMRINHLLEPMESLPNLSPVSLAWLSLGLLPLLLVGLHQ